MRTAMLLPIWLLAGTAAGATPPASSPRLMLFQTDSRVAVDAAGQVTAIESPSSLPAPITTALEAKIRRLRFDAPVLDGHTVAGETWVHIETCAAPVGDAYRLAMKFRGNGPSQSASTFPRFPYEAMRARASAKYEVVFSVGTDGLARVESAKLSSGNKSFSRQFEQSLSDWAGGMHFRPEVVAGLPVATRLSRQVEFLADGGSPVAFRRDRRKRDDERQQEAASSETCEAAMAAGDKDTTRQVALDSPIHVSEPAAGS